MKWSTLRVLFSGLIGNSIFVISLFSILAAAPIISGLITHINTSLALLGAIFVSLSYIAHKIFSPIVITQHKDYNEYYFHVKNLYENMALDIVHEFYFLEKEKKLIQLPVYKDESITMLKFNSIKSTIELLGDKRAIYYFALLKYDYMDNRNRCLRIVLTVSFFLGVCFLYWPASKRIFDLIIGGLTSGG